MSDGIYLVKFIDGKNEFIEYKDLEDGYLIDEVESYSYIKEYTRVGNGELFVSDFKIKSTCLVTDHPIIQELKVSKSESRVLEILTKQWQLLKYANLDIFDKEQFLQKLVDTSPQAIKYLPKDDVKLYTKIIDKALDKALDVISYIDFKMYNPDRIILDEKRLEQFRNNVRCLELLEMDNKHYTLLMQKLYQLKILETSKYVNIDSMDDIDLYITLFIEECKINPRHLSHYPFRNKEMTKRYFETCSIIVNHNTEACRYIIRECVSLKYLTQEQFSFLISKYFETK